MGICTPECSVTAGGTVHPVMGQKRDVNRCGPGQYGYVTINVVICGHATTLSSVVDERKNR